MNAATDSTARMSAGQGAADATDRHPPIDGSGDPRTIERSIERTRDRLDRILDALQDKLSPGQMLDRGIDYVKRNGGELANNFGRRVKQDPVPLVLTAVGFAWLISTTARATQTQARAPSRGLGDSARDLGESARDLGESAQESAHDLGESARDRARDIRDATGELFDRVGEGASEAADSVRHAANTAGQRLVDASRAVREQSRQAGAGLSRILREQPLLMGVVALAAGALFAAALPHTDTEDQWIGNARDDSLAQAKQSASDAYDNVRSAARSALHDSPAPDLADPASTRTH